MRTFRITHVYVVRGEDKEDARRELVHALSVPDRETDGYLDFESIREIVPEQGMSWRQEFHNQLFGRTGSVKQAGS